jgi:hypothetical protein
MKNQITDTILMIRPANFGYNQETAVNNSFQTEVSTENESDISKQAVVEFDNMVKVLEAAHVKVIVVEDTVDPVKPDALFPNNWISLHANKSIITYPMFAANRRIEKREDIVSMLEENYGYDRRFTFDFYESEDSFLEGTGSMVLDRANKIVYACISPRTNIKVLDKFCVLMNYQKVIFHSLDDEGEQIYHTNVMMAMGLDYVVICLDSIADPEERKIVEAKFASTNKYILDITTQQMNQFAGNMMQVKTTKGEAILVLSQAAYNSLKSSQIEKLESFNKLLPIDITTIEKYGGGSVRCMMAEVFY